jgi:hypothetical protein
VRRLRLHARRLGGARGIGLLGRAGASGWLAIGLGMVALDGVSYAWLELPRRAELWLRRAFVTPSLLHLPFHPRASR